MYNRSIKMGKFPEDYLYIIYDKEKVREAEIEVDSKEEKK